MALTRDEIAAASARLGVAEAALRAVLHVEARGSGFTHHRGQSVAVVLFEAHHFYRLSGRHPVSRDYPYLASRRWDKGLYNLAGRAVGPHEDRQRVRLEKAAALDVCYRTDSDELARAAHESCSWGLGQVMGSHWGALGYESVWDFVAHMERSEADQLDAMLRYVEAFHAADAMRAGGQTADSWRSFAARYNGAGYESNGYHRLIANAFNRFAK